MRQLRIHVRKRRLQIALVVLAATALTVAATVSAFGGSSHALKNGVRHPHRLPPGAYRVNSPSGARTQRTRLFLNNISADQLLSNGVVLTAPSSPDAPISLSVAEASAKKEMNSPGVKDAVLARCRLIPGGGNIVLYDHDCWVVSVTPVGATQTPAGVAPQNFAYAFALIDASSGELIRGFQATG